MASAKENPNKLHAGDMIERLRVRYPNGQYALLAEVGDSTGAYTSRHADAVALGLWPSRGLELEGFEIKVSRSDWRSELKKPKKAEAIQKYCQRWWIVAPRGVVHKDELPATWGLLQEHGEGLKIVKPSPLNENAKDMSRSFVAALLRRFSETMIPMSSVEPEIEKARQQVAEEQKRAHKYEREKHADLIKSVREFEEASGIQIVHGWNLPEVGNAVRTIKNLNLGGGQIDKIKGLQRALQIMHEDFDALIKLAEDMNNTSEAKVIKLKPSKQA